MKAIPLLSGLYNVTISIFRNPGALGLFIASFLMLKLDTGKSFLSGYLSLLFVIFGIAILIENYGKKNSN